MIAAVCVAPGNFVLEDCPEPKSPRKGWALLAVEHRRHLRNGLSYFEGKHPFLAYPRIMGHEVSGTVIAVGDDVGIPLGQEVYVNPYLACGECVACRQGKPNCCVKIEVFGVNRDGGMCERSGSRRQSLSYDGAFPKRRRGRGIPGHRRACRGSVSGGEGKTDPCHRSCADWSGRSPVFQARRARGCHCGRRAGTGWNLPNDSLT